MPHEEPLAPELLATAREVLLNEILPALPPDRHLAARMVANAMAIAARAADAAATPPHDARALAAAIRRGSHDPGTAQHAEVAALLDAVTHARCAVSAPKAVAR
jgi:hypothetical protein